MSVAGYQHPKLVKPSHEVLRAQMRVPAQHVYGLVTGGGGDFLIAEPGFHESRDGLMAQIVKAQAIDAKRSR